MIAGEDVAGGDGQPMCQGLADVDFPIRRDLGQQPRRVVGQFDQPRYGRLDSAVIEGRVQQPAVAPRFLALQMEHSGAGGEGEGAPDLIEPGIVVAIVLQDPLDSLRVADDEDRMPEIAALDPQPLEQLLVARRQRVGKRHPHDLQCRERVFRPRRGCQDGPAVDFLGNTHQRSSDPWSNQPSRPGHPT